MMISKRRSKQLAGATKKQKKKNRVDLSWTGREDDDDEHLSSSDDEEQYASSSEEEEETTEAKKIRLARAYLDKLKSDEAQESDDDDISVSQEDDHHVDAIATKLQRQRLLKRGTLQRNLAHLVERYLSDTTTETQHSSLKGHDLTPTCVSMSRALPNTAVSGSKDHSVIMWDLETLQKKSLLQSFDSENRNGGQVLAIAAAHNLVAVGRRDATVALYDVRSNKLATQFTGHKGPVTALAFQSDQSLFSASTDRCIRHYSVAEMAYIETLYGHQADVVSLDCLETLAKPLSVARDRTARVWKLDEDSHLIFRGGAQLHPAESCAVLKQDVFLTGHEQSGTLCLWSTHKKRTVATIVGAHQRKNETSFCGVSSLAACQQSDVAVSGSNDGYLRSWKILSDDKSKPSGMESIGKVPVKGFCNGIALAPDAKRCVVAVGQEPRLGRWERVPKAKNRVHVVKLRRTNISINSNEDELEYQEPDQPPAPSSDGEELSDSDSAE